MWGNVGVYLKLRGLVRWLYTEEHRWHQWSDKNFWPAPESHLFSGRRAQLRVEGAGEQGGDKQLSERWTGDVRNFLADRKLGRAEVSGTQQPLEVTTLETDIEKQSLAVIELGDLVCPHSECPSFAGCPQIFSSRFRACANTMFSQTVMDIAKDPENCPDNRVDKRVWNSVVHNPLCTHKGDSTQHAAYSARISVLENVYISWSGQTFDAENMYNQDGCSTSSDVSPETIDTLL